jgi:hypothetical protein
VPRPTIMTFLLTELRLVVQALKSFLDAAEAEVRSLISLYAEVVSRCHKKYVPIFLFLL